MGIAIFLLGFILSIVVWVLLAKRLRLQNKGVLLRHFVGFSVAFFVFITSTLISSIVDPVPVANESAKHNENVMRETSHNETVQASKVSTNNIQASQPITNANDASKASKVKQEPLLNLSLDDYIQQLNTTFKNAGSTYKVSKNLKIDSGRVNDTANFSLSDNVSTVLTLRKDTRELQSVLAIWMPRPSQSDNLEDLIAISAIISAVDSGDSMKSVGSKVVKKVSELMQKWSVNQDESHDDKFVLNNVVYHISVSSVTGVLISASSAE